MIKPQQIKVGQRARLLAIRQMVDQYVYRLLCLSKRNEELDLLLQIEQLFGRHGPGTVHERAGREFRTTNRCQAAVRTLWMNISSDNTTFEQ